MDRQRAKQIQSHRGRKSGRSVPLAHLPPESDADAAPDLQDAPLIREDGSIDSYRFMTLFLANVPAEVIEREFGLDPTLVKDQLTHIASETLFAVEELLEQMTLKNIARLEQLMTAWYPLAMSGSDKAHKAVLDSIRLEQDLLKNARLEISDRSRTLEGSAGEQAAAARLVEQFERTLTKSDALFDLAVQLGAGGEVLTELTAHLDELSPQLEVTPDADL